MAEDRPRSQGDRAAGGESSRPFAKAVSTAISASSRADKRIVRRNFVGRKIRGEMRIGREIFGLLIDVEAHDGGASWNGPVMRFALAAPGI